MPTCSSVKRFLSCCSALLGSLGALVLFLLLFQQVATTAPLPDAARNMSESSYPVAATNTCYARVAGSLAFTYTTVQAAVDAANDGDTVKVAGTCVGVQARVGVTQTVYISKNITLRGGYTTTNWTVSNPETNPTTLDALEQGRVLYVTGDISVTVEGLRITHGRTTGLDGDAGGGVYAITATLTVNGNQILSNKARYGGGLYLRNSPNATLTSNTISYNAASIWGAGGGAIFADSPGAWLSDNTISANYASLWDGGLSFGNSPNATLIGNTISENWTFHTGIKTAHNGGVTFDNSDGAILIGNTISGNSAPHTCGGATFKDSNSVTLIDNIISGNTAENSGGLCISYAEVDLIGNIISDNQSYGRGGGLNLYRSAVTLTNNVIVDNLADGSGSALYIKDSSPQMLHNTIARNSGGDGSGIHVTDSGFFHSSVTLTNTILVSHAVGISVTAGNTATLEATLWGTDTWANVADWGGAGVIITGTINRWGDPAFVDPDAGDYHIGSGSAAIDAGVDAGVSTDMDGQARPAAGTDYDIGADEFLAALRVSVQADPDPVQAGERLTYTVRVSNTGYVNLHATVTDTLPAHIMPGDTLTWTPTITAPGGVWSETFVVTVETGYVGPLYNVVQVTSDEGATGLYTGTTWVHNSTCYAQIESSPTITYTSVQAAVVAADDGDTVKVAGYCAGVESHAGVIQTVYISKSITLRGGYTITNWTVADPYANPTTLDAAEWGRVLYITGDISTTVEGLRIIGGYAVGIDGQWGYHGGGVLVVSATVTMSNNKVYGNIANNGGGLYLVSSANAALISNTINDNIGRTYAGGIYFDNSPSARLISNTISNNVANCACSGSKRFGGAYFAYSDNATLIDNIVSGNSAANRGGGLGFLESDNVTLISNTIMSNTRQASFYGNGIGLHFRLCKNVNLISNTIANNRGDDSVPGDIQGGGVYIEYSSSITLTGNTISSNQASKGGGVCLLSSVANLSGNIITANTAQDSPGLNGQGGGLYMGNSAAALTNTIITDNQAETAGSGLYVNSSSSQLRHSTVARNGGAASSGLYIAGTSSDVALTNTILVSHAVGISVTAGNTATLEATLWVNDADWGGDGVIITGSVNVWGNPAFVNPDAGDYHVVRGSAAIDTGVDAGITTDIDGDPRPMHCGVDVGADEWRGWCIFLPLLVRNWPPIPELYAIENSDSDGSYTVGWNDIGLELDYVLEEATNSAFTDATTACTTIDTHCDISGKGVARYYYRVKACNDGYGCGGWSNIQGVGAWWEDEDNDGRSQANGPLVFGVDYYGYPDDEWDCFKVDTRTKGEGEITVDLADHTGEDVGLQLRDQNNVLKGYDNTTPYHIEYTGPADLYYICILTESGYNSNTSYTLRVMFSSQVALKTDHGKYVTARGSGHDWVLEGDAEEIRSWEEFTLIWLGSNTIALETDHERYATAMDAGQNWVLGAETKTLSDCGKFTLIDLDNGKVAFKTCHDRYVTATDAAQDWVLRAETIPTSDWEKFELVSLLWPSQQQIFRKESGF